MRIKIPNTVPSVVFSLRLHHYEHRFCQRMLKCYIVCDFTRLMTSLVFESWSGSLSKVRAEVSERIIWRAAVRWKGEPPAPPPQLLPGWRGTRQRGPCLLCAPGSVCTINTTAEVAVGPRERCERPLPAPSSSPPASPPGPTHANAPRGTERVPGAPVHMPLLF